MKDKPDLIKDELTTEMQQEFTISDEDEEILRAGCVWNYQCSEGSSKEEITKCAHKYGTTYDVAMKWKDYWLKLKG